MKRSKINRLIKEAIDFFDEMNFKLPLFAHFDPEKMSELKESSSAEEIFETGMGWDITDFGTGEFEKTGLLSFTVRNGKLESIYTKPYAEKIMIVKEQQLTPHSI